MQRLLRLFLPHFIGLVLLGCGFAWAQQNAPNAQPTKPDLPVHKEEVVVTGTYEPVAVMDADRDVTLLEVHDTRALYPSLVDILRLDPAAADLHEILIGHLGGEILANLSIDGHLAGKD